MSDKYKCFLNLSNFKGQAREQQTRIVIVHLR
jgi:hypothetical protein